MPAEVESLAYTEARGVPWHGLGTPVDGLMTAAEAIVAAELGWDVKTEAIQTVAGEAIDSKKAVVRQTDRAVLGVVGNDWTPVQNADAFAFADAIVADNGAHYETAGSLRGGQAVFLSMELDAVEPIIINGDKSDIKTFLLLSNAHDGRSSLRLTVTPVRVVCANTLNLAFRGSKGTYFIRHTGDIDSKMAAARKAMGISIDYMKRFEAVAVAMSALKVTDARAEAVIRDAYAMTTNVEELGPESVLFQKHHAIKAMELYQLSPDLAPIRGTGWGVINAVAEYNDHVRPYGTDSTKMSAVMWGPSAAILNRTAALLARNTGGLSEAMDASVVRSAVKAAKRSK